jgi:hypothetical protein
LFLCAPNVVTVGGVLVKLDQWHEVLATEPATTNQVGAIHQEFLRLGFGEDERAERLAASAALLQLPELRSTMDLTRGSAGYLLRILQGFRDRGELDAAQLPRVSPWRELALGIVEAFNSMFGGR